MRFEYGSNVVIQVGENLTQDDHRNIARYMIESHPDGGKVPLVAESFGIVDGVAMYYVYNPAIDYDLGIMYAIVSVQNG